MFSVFSPSAFSVSLHAFWNYSLCSLSSFLISCFMILLRIISFLIFPPMSRSNLPALIRGCFKLNFSSDWFGSILNPEIDQQIENLFLFQTPIFHRQAVLTFLNLNSFLCIFSGTNYSNSICLSRSNFLTKSNINQRIIFSFTLSRLIEVCQKDGLVTKNENLN